MPSIPLYIGIPEDSNPQNEGDRQKTLFFIFLQMVNLLTTKHRFIGNKAPLYRHQSIPLSLTKCRLAGLEDSPNDRRG